MLDLSGKKVVVVGLGESGVAAAELASTASTSEPAHITTMPIPMLNVLYISPCSTFPASCNCLNKFGTVQL